MTEFGSNLLLKPGKVIMGTGSTLIHYLKCWGNEDITREDICATILCIADAGINLSRQISRHGFTGHCATAGEQDSDSNTQKPLEIIAHDVFETALRDAPVAFMASGQMPDLIRLNSQCGLAVVLNPLEDSSSIETNMPRGSLFSIFETDSEQLLEGKVGERQLAAGILVYGSQTSLVLSCGAGVQIFSLESKTAEFLQTNTNTRIPAGQRVLAVDTSNYRFWDNSIRYYIDDCLSGEDGPLGVDYKLRWTTSLLEEAHHILVRGGVYLYPADSRPGHDTGSLRLLFEALPLAFLAEQAGGSASDGYQAIREIELDSMQQRVPLIFGSIDNVDEVINYISGNSAENTRFPLFEHRSLLRN